MLHLWYWYKRRTRYSFKPVILVTGCSSGIGMAIAEMLYSLRSYRVVATSRRLDSLRERFEEDDRFWIRKLDVRSRADAEKLIQEINDKWGGVNILVNNAGISYRSVVEHMTDEDEAIQMDTNYLGPVRLVRMVLPGMREQGRGKIINISSVSGMLAMPTMASYSASKAAMEGMSEALWYEVRPLGINVSVIQPGFVHSKSFENVVYTKKSLAAKDGEGIYGDYYVNMIPFVARLMRLSTTRPRTLAKLVVRVIRTENPPLWIPATIDAMVFYYLRRFVPRRWLMPFLFWFLPKARKWGRAYTKRRNHK
ncbi:MAG: SDR family oxidoreductase [Bdellovibrionales bacterium]|nr:SDR family oxidoreductase [Bdellovibrionales bacterium]